MAADQKPDEDTLEAEGIRRLAEARIWKSLWDLDLRECYFFADPQRQRMILSTSPPPQQRLLDAAELNTDLAFILCADFATEVINTYMPEAQMWCERGPGMYVTDKDYQKIEKLVREADKQIFNAIKASNLYPEVSKAFEPDLAIGTVALWIEPPHPSSPIACKAVPIREFEINLGPDGEIDDRFAIRYTKNRYVERVVGKEIWAKVKAEIKEKCKKKPGDTTEVRWGFWRKWDRLPDVAWQHVVYIGNDLVHDAILEGDGSCPMIVFRWNPNPDWPWGHGPLLQGLPSFRQVDEYEIGRWEHAELSYRPPYVYPDDSFAAIEQGLEPGMGYPIRPGSESAIKAIFQPPPVDAANYNYEEKEARLRKLFYVDYPQQSGDTPPTLGQWLDEMARAQRRIGRPGLPFWREGPAAIFTRFKYLLERAQVIRKIEIDGKSVALMPLNPTQRAAEQQEIATAVQGLQTVGQFFPEEFKMWIDGKATIKALLDKMRIVLVKFRDEDTVNAAVANIQKLLGGQSPAGQVRGPPQGAANVAAGPQGPQ